MCVCARTSVSGRSTKSMAFVGRESACPSPIFLLVRTFPSPQSLHYAAPVAPFHPLFLFAAHYCCFPGVGVGRVLVDVSTILLAVRIA